jgi:hypothetical protein
LPPAHFDPASLPAFAYFTEAGLAGIWSGPIGRPDLAEPLVEPVPETQGSWSPAVRLPDGTVVSLFSHGDTAELVAIGATGEPSVLLDRAGASFGVAPEVGSIAVARRAGNGDGGVWQAWLDGRDPAQVLPALPPEELAGRDAVALGADGQAVAAAACDGAMQIRWPGGDPERLDLGWPIGFAADAALIAFRDCGRAGIVRLEQGADPADVPLPGQGPYSALLTPDRRRLAVLVQSETGPSRLVVRVFDGGEQAVVTLGRGGWDFTTDSTDRYLVLRRSDGDVGEFRFTWAVHDLLERWTGYFVVDDFPPEP